MISLRNQHGVGLVEVLVTVFVLAIGLLGVASLQLISSFTNAEAMTRTQAEFVAQQVSERLHAASAVDTAADGLVLNDAYFNSDNYNFTLLTCNTSGSDFDCFCKARPTTIPDCEGGQCSAAEMAQFDAWVLSCSAVQANPQASLAVSCTDNPTVIDTIGCSPGSQIQIQLRWPLRGQRNKELQNDTSCAQGTNQAFSCITKAFTL